MPEGHHTHPVELVSHEIPPTFSPLSDPLPPQDLAPGPVRPRKRPPQQWPAAQNARRRGRAGDTSGDRSGSDHLLLRPIHLTL